MAEAAEQSEPKEWYGEVGGHLAPPCSQSTTPPNPGGGPCTSGDTKRWAGHAVGCASTAAAGLVHGEQQACNA